MVSVGYPRNSFRINHLRGFAASRGSAREVLAAQLLTGLLRIAAASAPHVSRSIDEHGRAAAHPSADHVEREIFFRVLLGHPVTGHQDVQTLRTVIDGDWGVELESQSNQGVFESIGEERAIVGCRDYHTVKYSTDVCGAGDVLLAVWSITL